MVKIFSALVRGAKTYGETKNGFQQKHLVARPVSQAWPQAPGSNGRTKAQREQG